MPHLDGLAGFTHGNGLSLLLNYDADGRLTGMNTADGLTEVQDLTLVCDAAADITAITGNLDPTRSQSFDYDGVGVDGERFEGGDTAGVCVQLRGGAGVGDRGLRDSRIA